MHHRSPRTDSIPHLIGTVTHRRKDALGMHLTMDSVPVMTGYLGVTCEVFEFGTSRGLEIVVIAEGGSVTAAAAGAGGNILVEQIIEFAIAVTVAFVVVSDFIGIFFFHVSMIVIVRAIVFSPIFLSLRQQFVISTVGIGIVTASTAAAEGHAMEQIVRVVIATQRRMMLLLVLPPLIFRMGHAIVGAEGGFHCISFAVGFDLTLTAAVQCWICVPCIGLRYIYGCTYALKHLLVGGTHCDDDDDDDVVASVLMWLGIRFTTKAVGIGGDLLALG
mmetsp:Transcript_34750/g.75083  ORF Transcript_34750/g.75083 Transcript_34750/m.75083 type:complete len:275 (-) Transcript_34750:8-832(-)